ncbi:protein kinase domain-containing protein [Roseateles toxinivorans]|uniref:Serine/threonine protein kinase n=1 Tax=Roseateles toxinivorans TaxID=270368 RepID=A0A4R6QQF9_9BURK|nr:cache domain-containing protein [Roseateles toxinivorans]TDP72752.1 serine/threonine protein kinase [Roseateles toxinivorans]
MMSGPHRIAAMAQPPASNPNDDPTVIQGRSGVAAAEDPDATILDSSRRRPQVPRHDEDATVIKPRVTQVLPGPGAAPALAAPPPPRRPPLPKGNAIALPVGFRLHEYRIDAVLGQGGFGITYLATDVNLNAPVAVKEYLPEDIAFRSSTRSVSPNASEHRERYQQGLDSFLVEARTLASFRHPNIVRVARFFEAHDTAYMVLEYEKGASLKSWWPQHSEIGEKGLARLLQPLLDGLAVVHATGFLHRDIKPDNIQLRQEDGRLVLLDFGSAGQAVAVSDPATVVVTPGYAPIEQYGLGEQGPWTDIYALGATLYWMISGKKPPDAESRWMISQSSPSATHLPRDPMPAAVEVGRGRYSESFLQAIDWALNPDPKARPRDVAEWRTLLFAAQASNLSLRDALRSGDVLQGGAALVRKPRQGLQRAARGLVQVLHPGAWPLAVKMAVAMVLTALLPMLITAYYNLNGSLAAVSTSELRNLEQLARSTAGRLAQLIGDSQKLARSLGTDGDFTAFLAHPEPAHRDAIKSKLERLVAANRDIHLIMVMDAKGTALVSSDAELIGRNFAFRQYFKSAMQGQSYVTGIVVGAVAGAAGMFYAEPIFDASKQVVGAVVLRIRASSFASILDEVQDEAKRVSMLIDGDGVLIYHPREDLLYRSLMPLSADTLAAIRADQRFRRNDIGSLNLPELAAAIKSTQTMGHVDYQSAVTQRAEVAGFAPVPGHDWTVVVSEAREEFEAPLQQLFTHLLISVALVGLLFLGLALLFARSIVRPIKQLTQAAQALKNGDFDAATVTVRRRDEIGLLARTFNVMIDVLRQREREREHGGSPRE